MQLARIYCYILSKEMNCTDWVSLAAAMAAVVKVVAAIAVYAG